MNSSGSTDATTSSGGNAPGGTISSSSSDEKSWSRPFSYSNKGVQYSGQDGPPTSGTDLGDLVRTPTGHGYDDSSITPDTDPARIASYDSRFGPGQAVIVTDKMTGDRIACWRSPDGVCSLPATNAATVADSDWNIGTRALGLVQGLGGLAGGVASGAAIALGGAGAPITGGGSLLLSAAGWVGFAASVDQATAGFKTALTGEASRTFIGQGIEYATGASPQASELGAGLFTLSPTAATASLTNQGTQQFAASWRAAKTTYEAAPVVVRSPTSQPLLLTYTPTANAVSQVRNAMPAVPPAAQKPLLLTYTPTTHTLNQIRNMRGPESWQAAERYAQELSGSPGQMHYPVPAVTINGKPITGTGGRFVDAPVPQPNGGVVANEVKAYQSWRTVNGLPTQQFVPLREQIEQQILKDVWLRGNVPGYDPRWIFLGAPPSAQLSQQLTNNGIIQVIHH